MSELPFVKMHGCGNDYCYLDGFAQVLPPDLPTLARAMSDRHRGVGSDGLIALLPPNGPDHQAIMRMFNADGSESEMCGNGLRCLASLAHRRDHIASDTFAVATGAGVLQVEVQRQSAACDQVTVVMGAPRLAAAAIPTTVTGDHFPLRLDLELPQLGPCQALLVGMGNPHAVIFAPEVEHLDLAQLGPLVEHHPAFPRRCNTEFVQILPSEQGVPVLRQRTWERGSGETQACGTGACAVTVAAILSKQITGRHAIVALDGGRLQIDWPANDAAVAMRGEAVTIYHGHWPLAQTEHKPPVGHP